MILIEAASVLSFTLCFFLSNGTAVEPDCTFQITLMPNEPYRWIEAGAGLRNSVGFIQYNERQIFINTDYNHWRDPWHGLITAWEHEVRHAIGYLEWEWSGFKGTCPCRFHD